MRSSLALRATITPCETEIGRELARRKVDLLLSIDGPYALIQCQVSSAIAAAMLAPLKARRPANSAPWPATWLRSTPQ